MAVGTFSCAKCRQTKSLAEGTATASGLTCRTCAEAPARLAEEDGLDATARVISSGRVLVVVAALLLIGGTLAFGWDFVSAFVKRFLQGLG
jgi:hypothetical protein